MCFLLRTQLEKQTLTANARNETPPTDPTHSLEAARISQLEDKLERASGDRSDLQNQVSLLVSLCGLLPVSQIVHY